MEGALSQGSRAEATTGRPTDEAALVADVQRDRRRFGEIYERHAQAVFAHLVMRTAQRAVAEDLTAETFERALRAIERFEWRGIRLRGWLLRIADHLATDRLRRLHRRPTVRLNDEASFGAGTSAEEVAAQEAEAARIYAAIDALPTAQRLVLLLRLGQDLPHAEIGQALGRSEGAVRMLYSRAASRLREELSEQ